MRRRLVNLVRLTCCFVYRVLPPGLCTRLAYSWCGRVLGSWLVSPGGSVYPCDFGIKLRLSPEDALITGIAYMGRTNPLETELVRKYLKFGDTLVQIGTYKDGWLALVGSSAVGSQGHVVCFEPISEYAECLKRNVNLNNRNNIIVEQFAVSDATGNVRFSVAGGNSSMVLTDKPNTVTVKSVSLDEYVRSKNITTIDFLIIDVEGAELLVLKGGRRTLENSVSFLLMEVIDDFLRQSGTSAQQLVQTVIAMGFHPYVITREGLRPWEPGKESETLNMFFTKMEIML